MIPYILRLELLEARRHVGAVSRRSPTGGRGCASGRRSRPTIFDRMTEADWAPFKNLAPDPWPKVQTLLKAA